MAASVSTSSQGYSISGTVSVAAPTGIQVGDILVLFCYGKWNTGYNASSSGFTQRISNNNGGEGLTILSKVAVSGDTTATSYSVTNGQTEIMGVIMTRIVGAQDDWSQVNTQINVTNGVFNSVDITPTYANSLICFFAWNTPYTATQISNFAIVTNNPTWTTEQQIVGNSGNAIGPAGLGWAVRPQTTSTGDFSITDPGTDQQCAVFALPPTTSGQIKTLVVAGGGGSANGGGGGGGVLYSPATTIVPASYTITVGAGGTGSATVPANGANSSIAGTGVSITAIGGGYGGIGGGPGGSTGGSGGSGGGGNPAGTATVGQGNNGGANSPGGFPNDATGGGGGAGAVGATATAATGGNGGVGTANSISGSSVTYAGGGGGCGRTTSGTGGAGGGGNAGAGGTGTNGTANTGGGAGGSDGVSFKDGGSGIVIVRYVTADFTTLGYTVTGGTITTSGADTIHTFTSSGTLTISAGTDYPMTAVVGAFTLTGITTLFYQALQFVASVGTFTMTGIDALFGLGKGIIAETGAFILSGTTTLFQTALTMATSTGSFVMTGVAATFIKGINLVADIGSFILTGNAVRLPKRWSNLSKNSASWINPSKNSSTFSNQSKSSSTWTNTNKTDI